MDTEQLKCFISVAQTLNFTEAAKQNYITQPAISRQISELERSLGVKLLYRTRHSVSLTEEGQAFLQYAINEIDSETEIRTRLRNIEQGRLGCVSIAMLDHMTYVLSDCLSIFAKKYPLIQLKIDRMSGSVMSDILKERRHDFYFGAKSTFGYTHAFNYIETHDEHFVLAVHKDDAWHIDPDDVSTFANMPFALISRSAGPIYFDRTMEFCRQIGYAPPLMSYFNCAEAVMLAVNAGIGISILHENGARASHMSNVKLLPFNSKHVSVIGAVGWRQDSLSNAPSKFLEVLQELYPEDKHPIMKT